MDRTLLLSPAIAGLDSHALNQEGLGTRLALNASYILETITGLDYALTRSEENSTRILFSRCRVCIRHLDCGLAASSVYLLTLIIYK